MKPVGVVSLRAVTLTGPTPTSRRVESQTGSVPALELALVIVPQNIEDQPQAPSGRNQKADDGQAGVAEEFERGLNAHQQSGPRRVGRGPAVLK